MAEDLIRVFIKFNTESALCMEDFAPCKIVHTKRLGYNIRLVSHMVPLLSTLNHLFICLTLTLNLHT